MSGWPMELGGCKGWQVVASYHVITFGTGNEDLTWSSQPWKTTVIRMVSETWEIHSFQVHMEGSVFCSIATCPHITFYIMARLAYVKCRLTYSPRNVLSSSQITTLINGIPIHRLQNVLFQFLKTHHQLLQAMEISSKSIWSGELGLLWICDNVAVVI